jgi:hypothetical protein
MAFLSSNNTIIGDDRSFSANTSNSFTSDTGFIEVLSSPVLGSVAGFTVGGGVTSSYSNVMDRFPFATDTNATSIGTLGQAIRLTAGQNSSIRGYTSGAYLGPPFSGNSQLIQRYDFGTNLNGVTSGQLTSIGRSSSGISSAISGYASGGNNGPTAHSNIEKFSFSAEGNSVSVGTLSTAKAGGASASSTTSGYTAGGYGAQPTRTLTAVIDKFPFATDTNGTSIGQLTTTKAFAIGNSSGVAGYASGNETFSTTIEKYSFITDGSASSVATLLQSLNSASSQNTPAHGYVSGGSIGPAPAPTYISTIQKFTFATDANATAVGSLSTARGDRPAGASD